ncbi:MAG: DUF4838 domain-containing protein, partial [Eubacteriales bacterium]
DTLQMVIQQVRDILEANPDARIISLTQHDNGDYCQCPACKAIDENEGSQSGTMIHFVNAVADAVKEDYPNVAFDTFAYGYTTDAPLHVIPRDNVMVRLCSSGFCFAHALNDNSCKVNINFSKQILAWQKICKRLYIWDYTANFSHFIGPFNNFGVLQPNIQFFAENHVKGIYEEGNFVLIGNNAEFAELRAYLLSKLLWNPNIDYDKTMNDFLRAYYGKGWQYIREYINMTIKKSGNGDNHMPYDQQMTAKGVFNLTRNEVEYCNDLWEKATALAETETQVRNIKMSELSWRYWKGCNKVSEFSRIKPIHDWMAANEALYDDYIKYDIKYCSQDSLITDIPEQEILWLLKTNFWLIPSKWR